MLKELLGLFRTDDTVARMGEDFSKMLDLSQGLTVRSGRILLEEASEGDDRKEIRKSEVQINKLERKIRKQVIARLTLGTDAGAVTYCLLLMSIVKDVERIGDYAKNLAEIHYEGGGPIPDDENGADLRAIRGLVEGTFGSAHEVFVTSDSKTATDLIKDGRKTNRRCDKLIRVVAGSAYDAATTTSLVLGARYYKRIESHLLNILSGVVMPLHKLDYYDEKVLDPDTGE
jgi:phosphate transport system protein